MKKMKTTYSDFNMVDMAGTGYLTWVFYATVTKTTTIERSTGHLWWKKEWIDTNIQEEVPVNQIYAEGWRDEQGDLVDGVYKLEKAFCAKNRISSIQQYKVKGM